MLTLKNISKLIKFLSKRVQAYNLGTGRGVSVLELIRTFEQTNDVKIAYAFEARRHGDISSMYADP